MTEYIEETQESFEYGYKYIIPPFEDYEEYVIAIPLRDTNEEDFGDCYLMTNKGKRCKMFHKGIAPLNIDICSNKTKIPKRTMDKLFNK
jgi:hypothetical protein